MLVLSGGTGTPKLLLGLKEHLLPEELSVVVNTAEDLWLSGNYICPDVDTVLYTFADLIDEKRWWGIKGDRTLTHDSMIAMGYKEKLLIGDRDRAVHIFRSDLIRRGAKLSEATEVLAESLGVRQRVVPMTDEKVTTIISTSEGVMPFHDFWVERRGKPEVLGLAFAGLEDATPNKALLKLLKSEKTVLIGPSNPVSSIGPILDLPGVRKALLKKRVIAVSPFAGDRPYSGPAAQFMKAKRHSADDDGVIEMLGHVDLFVIDKKSRYKGECESVRMSTRMRSRRESVKVAADLLKLIDGKT